MGRYIKNDGTVKIGYSEGNKLKKIITNEKELSIKVEELDNNVEENNKKTLYIYQSLKELLGQNFISSDFKDNNDNNDK